MSADGGTERLKYFFDRGWFLKPSSYQIRNADGTTGGWIAQVHVIHESATGVTFQPLVEQETTIYPDAAKANSAAAAIGLAWLERNATGFGGPLARDYQQVLDKLKSDPEPEARIAEPAWNQAARHAGLPAGVEFQGVTTFVQLQFVRDAAAKIIDETDHPETLKAHAKNIMDIKISEVELEKYQEDR